MIKFSWKYLISFLVCAQIGNSQCLAPIDQYSSMTVNPIDEVNGIFDFDYYITADIELSTQRSDGTPLVRRINTDFYVNSADGSAFFPQGFFTSNFGRASNRQGEIFGAIWRANGQMVSYVQEASSGIKRAILVEVDQNTDDVFLGQYTFISKFMTGIRDATSIPAPIPVHLPWGRTEGFVSEIEQADGSTGKITIYFSLEPDIAPIKTSVPTVGFLVGVMKDFVFHNCNRLAVFTKMEIMGTPNYMQAELLSIEPKRLTFAAEGYKKTILAAGNISKLATMTEEEQENMIASQQSYSTRIQAKMLEIEACGTNACRAAKTREMQALVKEKQDAMYDLMTDTSGAGGAGSDLLNQQRALRDEMYELTGQMKTKELECKRYAGLRSTPESERCNAEIEAIKIEMKRLECEMAKLHGFEDSMDDCE